MFLHLLCCIVLCCSRTHFNFDRNVGYQQQVNEKKNCFTAEFHHFFSVSNNSTLMDNPFQIYKCVEYLQLPALLYIYHPFSLFFNNPYNHVFSRSIAHMWSQLCVCHITTSVHSESFIPGLTLPSVMYLQLILRNFSVRASSSSEVDDTTLD